MDAETATSLRAPFDPAQIGKLPKINCRDCTQASGKVCGKHEKKKCRDCAGYLTTAHIHLDYVGHAAVTDRLLSVDPEWSWEPYGLTPEGVPAFSVSGGETSLWIRLTVAGVTRPAVGTAASGSFELPKQLVSDAIRNGAMRFGVALDLWSKEDLHGEGEPDENRALSQTELARLIAAFDAIGDDAERGKAKKEFVERFCVPAELRTSQLQDALDWIAERPFG